jgi:hypothetical protein
MEPARGALLGGVLLQARDGRRAAPRMQQQIAATFAA